MSDDFMAKGLEMMRRAGFPVAGIHTESPQDRSGGTQMADRTNETSGKGGEASRGAEGVTRADQVRAAELYLECRRTAYHRQDATTAIAAALAEERAKARAEVLAERGTCGDRSPAVAWLTESGVEMCVLPPDHKGAHQAASDGVYAPMRWIRDEESQ